jgi:hypothetical protein
MDNPEFTHFQLVPILHHEFLTRVVTINSVVVISIVSQHDLNFLNKQELQYLLLTLHEPTQLKNKTRYIPGLQFFELSKSVQFRVYSIFTVYYPG